MLQPSNPILVAARLVKAILFSSSKPSKGFGPAMLRHTFRSHLRRAASRLAAKAASSWRLECEEWGSETFCHHTALGRCIKTETYDAFCRPNTKKTGAGGAILANLMIRTWLSGPSVSGGLWPWFSTFR